MSATGDVIDNRFTLILPLGEQKPKELWVAEDLRDGSKIALVIYSPGKGQRHRVGRFCQVMQKLVELRHPNVVTVYAVGTTRLGVGYASMELLEGDTLADRLAEKPTLWASEFMNIATEFLEGLAVLHDHGIVHGDIEPSNIFFVSDYGRLMPKVAGLGYSRSSVRADKTFADREDEGYLRTLAYASPEQVSGREDIDIRTDIYSFGVVLYEAFSGNRPYHGESCEEIRKVVINSSVTPLHEIRSQIPEALSNLIGSMMDTDPTRRYDNARGVQRDLLSLALALPESFKNSPLPKQPRRS